MDDLLSELVLSKFRANPESFDGKLGEKLYAVVVENGLKRVVKEEIPIDVAPELLAKFQFLKACEKDSDLGWMGMASWHILSPAFRSRFSVILEPLMWGSVYFQFSKFKEIQDGLLSFENGGVSLFVLREIGGFQVVCLSSTVRNLNLVSNKQFDAIRSKIASRIVYSVGQSSDGRILMSLPGGPDQNG
jgi:hypothetical protein